VDADQAKKSIPACLGYITVCIGSGLVPVSEGALYSTDLQNELRPAALLKISRPGEETFNQYN